MKSNVLVMVFDNTGYCHAERISPTYDDLIKVLFNGSDRYFDEVDIHIGNQKYHVYMDSDRFNDPAMNIVGYDASFSSFRIGKVMIAKVDRNGDLYSLSDTDLANIKNSMYITKCCFHPINGERHRLSKIILKYDF